ncbi:MAG: undecaprenyldiphospho-muramoylpentapeptide beta-N-acetylglucosaminyltransferase [Bacteroidetes bacterium]|nr:undecaprenyldiphospho-muramoylpentapeptide beta-N-acetylglucosaminyltransferase [Bacteroidota bacterium]MBU1577866.1 undecaprenyldiphospho-muramoylpentapeptide beta-N-acetylglucosaminyltransferase [Bacteroidota bacterium]MBU2557662.1 undecaprenyldiphospho-muramoylpentapeptide beta-N-acetylglucosaminyltransferase [Bacteroidota bacterium]
MTQESKRIILSGGGTGGHIFPAIAIADALRRRMPDAAIHFVGASGRMEMSRVPKAGYSIDGLWISGLQRKLSFDNFLFPLKVVVSLLRARRILKKFRPQIVIGVGGYASGPTLQAAVQLGIPTLIQEQNSFPGITNRLLAKKVNKICTAYDKMEKWFPSEKTVLTGNPLRKQAVQVADKREAGRAFFKLDQQLPVALIVGGSQGALAINYAISEQINLFEKHKLQLIWQTGQAFAPQAATVVEEAGLAALIHVTPFIDRMDLAYAAADLVVSRAGAMAIAELAVVQKPVIFVPLPTAAENHQYKNARRLVDKNAALLIENQLAKAELVPAMIKLIASPKIGLEMAEAIGLFALPNADEAIVDEIVKLIKR